LKLFTLQLVLENYNCKLLASVNPRAIRNSFLLSAAIGFEPAITRCASKFPHLKPISCTALIVLLTQLLISISYHRHQPAKSIINSTNVAMLESPRAMNQSVRVEWKQRNSMSCLLLGCHTLWPMFLVTLMRAENAKHMLSQGVEWHLWNFCLNDIRELVTSFSSHHSSHHTHVRRKQSEIRQFFGLLVSRSHADKQDKQATLTYDTRKMQKFNSTDTNLKLPPPPIYSGLQLSCKCV